MMGRAGHRQCDWPASRCRQCVEEDLAIVRGGSMKIPTMKRSQKQREHSGLSADAPAAKFDSGKLPWDLLPYDAVQEIVKVLQFGAQKYAARNWEKGLPHSRTFAATMRHLVAHFQKGETHDPETGISHLAHAACEILFALAFEVRGRKELDDRPTPIVERNVKDAAR